MRKIPAIKRISFLKAGKSKTLFTKVFDGIEFHEIMIGRFISRISNLSVALAFLASSSSKANIAFGGQVRAFVKSYCH